MMDITNPRYNENGTIDCEWNHPEYGIITFTASPDDVEPHGRAVFDWLVAGAFGPVAPFAP